MFNLMLDKLEGEPFSGKPLIISAPENSECSESNPTASQGTVRLDSGFSENEGCLCTVIDSISAKNPFDKLQFFSRTLFASA